MESTLLLDIVIREGLPIFKLLASEDETLLIRRNTFLILDLLLHSFNSIRRLRIQSNGLAREGLHEKLHPTTETEDKVESTFLLDVVIGEGLFIFKLLASKDETLLIRRNTLLILDLLLNVSDIVGSFSVESNSLASECLYKDLHIKRVW